MNKIIIKIILLWIIFILVKHELIFILKVQFIQFYLFFLI